MQLTTLTRVTTSSTESFIAEETVNKISAFSAFWESLDWEHLTGVVLSKGINLLITLIVIGVIRFIGNKIIQKSFETSKKKATYSENRLETLRTIVSNVFSYFLYFIIIYTILTLIGVPVASLIAGAGIAGIAIGLGAQGFISDVLTGFFIILERQIDVGNHVIIDHIEGTVAAIGMRTTQIKGFDGTLHFIPNRNILVVSNLSRGTMRATIKIRIKPEHNVNQIKAIIETTNQNMVPAYPDIQSAPKVIGVVDLGNGGLAMQINIETSNGAQYKVQADFLAAYIGAITEAGIELPHSPVNLTI